MFAEKLQDMRSKDIPEKKEEQEKVKAENVNKAASFFKKKKK